MSEIAPWVIALPLALGAVHLVLLRARGRSGDADHQSPLTGWINLTLYVGLGASFIALFAISLIVVHGMWLGVGLSVAWGVLLGAHMNRVYGRLAALLDHRKLR